MGFASLFRLWGGVWEGNFSYIFCVFFPRLSNGVVVFAEFRPFDLEGVWDVLYLGECIFDIFFDSLDRGSGFFLHRGRCFPEWTFLFFSGSWATSARGGAVSAAVRARGWNNRLF